MNVREQQSLSSLMLFDDVQVVLEQVHASCRVRNFRVELDPEDVSAFVSHRFNGAVA